jgi:hypothetical protein
MGEEPMPAPKFTVFPPSPSTKQGWGERDRD